MEHTVRKRRKIPFPGLTKRIYGIPRGERWLTFSSWSLRSNVDFEPKSGVRVCDHLGGATSLLPERSHLVSVGFGKCLKGRPRRSRNSEIPVRGPVPRRSRKRRSKPDTAGPENGVDLLHTAAGKEGRYHNKETTRDESRTTPDHAAKTGPAPPNALPHPGQREANSVIGFRFKHETSSTTKQKHPDRVEELQIARRRTGCLMFEAAGPHA